MATYQAFAVIGQAIIHLFEDASPVEFPGAQFKLFQASDFSAPRRILKEGLSVYLMHVSINAIRRNLQPRIDPVGKPSRPPIPLELRFLITPWAATAEKRSRLLGWVIRLLGDTPILTPAFLNQLDPKGVIFPPGEAVELLFDPVSPTDMAILCQSLKQAGMLPSVSYVARLSLEGVD